MYHGVRAEQRAGAPSAVVFGRLPVTVRRRRGEEGIGRLGDHDVEIAEHRRGLDACAEMDVPEEGRC